MIFKLILRRWKKQSVYPLVSIGSLVLGLTCSLLLIAFVRNEYRIARAIPDGKDIYVVQRQHSFFQQQQTIYGAGRGDLMQPIRNRFAEIVDYCIMHNYPPYRLSLAGESLPHDGFFQVTPNFTDYFHPRMVAGNLRETLSRPQEVALTATCARELFGSQDAIGKSITFTNQRDKERTQQLFTVTAIVDDSEPDLLNYRMLIGIPVETMEAHETVNRFYYFVRLAPGASAGRLAESINRQEEFKEDPLALVPLREVYFRNSSIDATQNSSFHQRYRPTLQIALLAALLILGMACFNYITIALARYQPRLRSLALQKVYGAGRGRVLWQLSVETGLQVLIACTLSLVLITLLVPAFSRLMEARFTAASVWKADTLLLFAALTLFTIGIPTLFLFFKQLNAPAVRLLRVLSYKKQSTLHLIIILQFAVCSSLLLFSDVIRRQFEYITQARPHSDAVFEITQDAPSQVTGEFIRRLRQIPEVSAITRSGILTYSNANVGGNVIWYMMADSSFLDFFRVRLLKGENFSPYSGERSEVLINETFKQSYYPDEEIPFAFSMNGSHRAIGIVADFPLSHFSTHNQPLVVECGSGYNIAVRIDRAGQRKTALAKIRDTFEEIAPHSNLEITSMAEIYTRLHSEELKAKKVTSIFSWLSILLSCLGLFGLALYSVECRRKEIALRKINGSTERQVILRLIRRFLGWVLAGFLLALPVGWYISRLWLSRFVYRAEIPWGYFILTGILLLLIGGATVVIQSIRAARNNPIESIRTE